MAIISSLWSEHSDELLLQAISVVDEVVKSNSRAGLHTTKARYGRASDPFWFEAQHGVDRFGMRVAVLLTGAGRLSW